MSRRVEYVNGGWKNWGEHKNTGAMKDLTMAGPSRAAEAGKQIDRVRRDESENNERSRV